MRALLSALSTLCLGWFILAGSVDVAQANCTAPCTKSQITSDITTNWPDNVSGQITPVLLRSTVEDLLNSYLDVNGSSTFGCSANQFMTGIASLSTYTCAAVSVAGLTGFGTG